MTDFSPKDRQGNLFSAYLFFTAALTGALVMVVDDDYNPLDVMDPELHEGVRQAILKTTPAAILLHG